MQAERLRAEQAWARVIAHRAGLASESVIDRGRALAEEGDPMKAFAEILGYTTTPDFERAAEAMMSGGKHLAVGCHDGMKTFGCGALLFAWEWFCKGCLPAEDGKPQGGILALVAPTEEGMKSTSWKAINVHAERAASRGWHLPGYDPESIGANVIWRAEPHRWFITGRTFRPPASAIKKPIIAAGSGLKHPTNLVVWGEEADEIDARYHRTIEGWGPRLVFFTLNPYSPSGPAFDLVQGAEWVTSWFSAMRIPQVLARKISTPGLADHRTLENEVRHRVTPISSATE